MTYLVEFTAAAARQLRKLDRPVRLRLITAIEGLAEDPRPAGATKLVATGVATRHARRRFVADDHERRTALTSANSTSADTGGLPGAR